MPFGVTKRLGASFLIITRAPSTMSGDGFSKPLFLIWDGRKFSPNSSCAGVPLVSSMTTRYHCAPLMDATTPVRPVLMTTTLSPSTKSSSAPSKVTDSGPAVSSGPPVPSPTATTKVPSLRALTTTPRRGGPSLKSGAPDTTATRAPLENMSLSCAPGSSSSEPRSGPGGPSPKFGGGSWGASSSDAGGLGAFAVARAADGDAAGFFARGFDGCLGGFGPAAAFWAATAFTPSDSGAESKTESWPGANMGLLILLRSNAPPSSLGLPSSSTANQPRCFLSRIVATRPPAVMAWTAPTGTGPGPDCCTDDLRPLEEPEPLGFGTNAAWGAASSKWSWPGAKPWGRRMDLRSPAPPSSFAFWSSSTLNQPRCIYPKTMASRPPVVRTRIGTPDGGAPASGRITPAGAAGASGLRPLGFD